MGSSKFLLFLLLSFSSHHFLRLFVEADTNLIQKTCSNTKYYELCFSSLKSNPSSQDADPKGLALIMVGIGIANSTATSSYLSSQLLSTSIDTIMKKVLKECADKYSYAVDALQASVPDLASEDYDYASMHITAAADYPNACHNAFKRYNGLVYHQELANREDGLKHICDVVLGIIDNIGW
ncbi:hypothetical protein UlMin_006598 [Ulmus minor]